MAQRGPDLRLYQQSTGQRSKSISSIETDEGCVVLDHKTFTGAPDTWIEKALSFAPQIALYRRIFADAVAQPILASFIHMPVVRKLMRIEPN